MALSSAAIVTRLAGRAPALALDVPLTPAPARACGRAVHFIDIENLCGTPHVRIFEAKRTMRDYHAAAQIAEGDHVIIASSHHNAIAAGTAWPGARLLAPKSGLNGADIALREAIRTERIAERFGLVCLASGDGGFGDDLAFLAKGGAETHVFARKHSLSAALRLAAHRVTTLPTASHA